MTTPTEPLWPVLVAEVLEGFSDWIDTEIAAGVPPKAVARQAALQLRFFSRRLRTEGKI
jgi:hypothetical protein